MKPRIKWRPILIVLLVFALFAAVFVFLYRSPVRVPGFLSNHLTDFVRQETGLTLDPGILTLQASERRIDVRQLAVSLDPERPIATIGAGEGRWQPGISLQEIGSGSAPFEQLFLQDVQLDLSAPRPSVSAPGAASEPFSLPELAGLPFHAISWRNVTLLTPYGSVLIETGAGTINRVSGTIEAWASFAANPLGGKGRLQLHMPLYGGISKVALKWTGVQVANFGKQWLPVLSLLINITGDDTSLDLTWEGNLEEAINNIVIAPVEVLRHGLQGNLRMSPMSVSTPWLSSTIQATASSSSDSFWNLQMSAESEDAQALRIEGRWGGDQNAPWRFGAEIEGKRLRLPPFVCQLLNNSSAPVEPGMIDLHATLRGDAMHLSSEGIATFSEWVVPVLGTHSAAISWKQVGPILTGEIDHPLQGGRLLASWAFSLPTLGSGLGSIQGQLEKIDLAFLGSVLPGEPTGYLSGSFDAFVDAGSIASSQCVVEFLLEEVQVAKLTLPIVQGLAEFSPDSWLVRNPKVSFLSGGSAELQGFISQAQTGGRISSKNLRLTDLGLEIDYLDGQLDLSGELKGPLDQAVLKGNLTSADFAFGGYAPASIQATIELSPSRVTLRPVVGTLTYGGTVDLGFAWDIARDRVAELDLIFDGVRMDEIVRYLPEHLQTGTSGGAVAGKALYIPAKDRWVAEISGTDCQLASENLQNFHGQITYSNGTGAIEHFFLRSAGGTIDASGRFAGKDDIRAAIIIENIALDRINHVQKLLPKARGAVNGEGTIEWTPAGRRGFFTLFARDLAVGERKLGNVGAQVDVESERVVIRRGVSDALGLSLNGELRLDDGFSYQAQLDMQETDLSFIPFSYGFRNFQDGDLVANGRIQLAGRLAHHVPEMLAVNLQTFAIRQGQDMIVAPKPIDILFQNEKFEVRSFELKYRQGVFGLQGIIDPQGATTLTLEGKDFSLRALATLLELPWRDFDGDLSGRGSVLGSFPNISLQGDLGVKDLRIGNRRIPALETTCVITPETVSLRKSAAIFPGSRIEMTGIIPLQDLASSTALDLRLSIPKADLRDLLPIFPDILQVASGTANGTLHFRGSPLRPSVAGDLRVSAQDLAFKGMRKNLRNVEFGIKTADDIIALDPCSAHLGNGILLGTGTIDFANDAPGSLTLHIGGENLDVIYKGVEINGAAVDFDVHGNAFNPVVRGKILIPRGRLSLADWILQTTSKTSLPLESLDYRISVEIPRNFWVKNAFLNAEMRGKFSIFGDLEQPRIDGRVSCVQGRLHFQRRQFLVDTGEITFGERDGQQDPSVFLKSATNIQNTQVYLTLQGQVSSFTTSLHSSPPMSEGDLVSLLALGRNLEEAKRSDPTELFESEILDGLKNTYISGLLGSTLSSALNLDELFLGSLFDRSQGATRSFVRIGKYIGSNLFLAYEGTLSNEDKKTYILEYRLPRGFFLDVEVEKPTDRNRIGIKYDWKF